VSVAFSPSLTGTPPMPRNPPSVAASATCWLIWRSQPLKAAASPGALVSTTAPACRSVSIHLALISPALLPVSCSLTPSRAMLRPSALSKFGDNCFDERVRSGVHFGRHQRSAAGEALFQKAPEPAWLGSGDRDACHHHTFQDELPFVGREVRLIRHKLLLHFEFTAGAVPANHQSADAYDAQVQGQSGGPWQLISSSSSRSAPMCGTTASGRTRNDGRCTGGHNSVQYVLSHRPLGARQASQK
jgi:hypothetical protein